MKSLFAVVSIVLVSSLLSGCGSGNRALPFAHEDLDAAAWMQTSAEYRVLVRETFARAAAGLPQALKDSTWSAIAGQPAKLLAAAGDAGTTLPPAVILDVDETVLDTTEFQWQLIESQGEYTPELWQQFVTTKPMPLVPGAKEFVAACRDLGITVFYITNREVEVERYTRENLEQHGMIDPAAIDNILSKGERQDWTVDKTSRRAYVAARFRVLQILGDDLNDFLWVKEKPTAQERREAAEQQMSLWGRQWFMLPNANYGGWERALHDFDDALPRSEKLIRKAGSLQATIEAKRPATARVEPVAR